jgi:isoleucyl-tRNA synthetase
VFNDLTAEASFTRIEEEVRRFWRLHSVPEAFYAADQLGDRRTFHQQPLVALGGESDTQVRLLVAGDLLARYFAMRGHSAFNYKGWLCHGLSVELAVEHSLGPEVAGYDLAGFNNACRHAALEGVRRGEAGVERMAIWPSPGSTFLSLEPSAIGRVWNVLHRLYQAGSLKEEHRVVPFCPRCATPLSSSEATRHVQPVEKPAAWFRLPWGGEPNTYLLAWVAQPWMLVGMVALAAHPATSYAMVELPPKEGAPPARLILAESAIKRLLPEGARLVRRISTRTLRSARYRPPFTFLPADEGAGRVLLDEAVPQNRGTGLWPVMPAFEPLSLQMAHHHNLPIPDMLDDWGNLDDRALSWRGLSPLDAETLLIEDLEARGLLFERQETTQSHSLCPHCRAAMFPLARPVWLAEGEGEPWVVGRDRAWGVPLPVWVCQQCGGKDCIAGLDDLAKRVNLQVAQIDPHRPAIDRLVMPCEACGGTMHRVPAVLDAHFEAAALSWTMMDFSGLESRTAGMAHSGLTVGLGDEQSAWLGNLSTLATLMDSAPAWDHLLTLQGGAKDSEPDSSITLERAGSGDALRWAAYAGIGTLQAESDFLRPLWRWVSSIPLSGDVGQQDSGLEAGIGGAAGQLLDRWLAARVHETVGAVARALEALDLDRATRALSACVSDLVDWYAPLRPGAGGEVIETLTGLLAPFLPHLADAIHRQRRGRIVESVHLAGWPTPDPAWEDRALLSHMYRVKRLAALGKAALADAGLEPDQWTGWAVAGLLDDDLGDATALAPFEGVLARALGAERVRIVPGAASRVQYRLSLGPEQRIERDIASDEIESVLANLDAAASAQLAAEFREGLSASLPVSGQNVALLPADVKIAVRAQPGWIAAADAELLIMLEIAPDEAGTLT